MPYNACYDRKRSFSVRVLELRNAIILRSLEPGTSQSLVLRGLIDSVQTYIERSAGSWRLVSARR